MSRGVTPPDPEEAGPAMSTGMLLALLLGALVLAGVTGALVTMLRVRPAAGRIGANPMVPRLVGEVHAGEEQVLICLARSLGVVSGKADVRYGDVYVAGAVGGAIRLASRSEIGRGYDGEIRVHRTRHHSVAEYYLLRLPGDETLHQRILRIEDDIAAALRDLDPAVRLYVGGRGPRRQRDRLPQSA